MMGLKSKEIENQKPQKSIKEEVSNISIILSKEIDNMLEEVIYL